MSAVWFLGKRGKHRLSFTQAAQANLVDVANRPAAPLAEALIVPKIQTFSLSKI